MRVNSVVNRPRSGMQHLDPIDLLPSRVAKVTEVKSSHQRMADMCKSKFS